MPIIPFLSDHWQLLTKEQLDFLYPRADLRFRNGYTIGWGRRFSILLVDGDFYAINSAYGLYHLENLMSWLYQQQVILNDYSNYLNQGMKELNI